MKLIQRTICCFVLLFLLTNANAQLYKINLQDKIDKASIIVEAKVIAQRSFWNDEHTMIYTDNTLQVYKSFKGKTISKQINVITQGGSVGNKALVVSDMLQLHKSETGMFFCVENALKLHSPSTKNILYDVYSSGQGFLKYDMKNNTASAPFVTYKNIKRDLYSLIKSRTGVAAQVIDNSFDTDNSSILHDSAVSNGTAATLTSFSPVTVHAGALNDPTNNVLTINGAGFGNSPSGSAGLNFKDGNNDHSDPDYFIAYNSPYIVSWADTKIVVKVPDQAATGKFSVVLNDGTTTVSSTSLNVFFAVLDAAFTIGSTDVAAEPRLVDANGSGGYTCQYSTSTAGKGVDFSNSTAKATFERALTTWKEIAGANLITGNTTTTQKIADDNVNVIEFDNTNTSVPNMADGVLEATYSWFSACTAGTGLSTAQKTGFDILVRNDAVSKGTKITLEDGPCFPATNTYDLEMIFLHEIGHALNLAHINDDYEDGGNAYITLNPSKVMHYSILDYENRRSPDVAAYQGALYTITPQGGNDFGTCDLPDKAFTPLTKMVASTDECPSTFPSTEITNNTKIFFDLVHATSDKLTDPSFRQVNCQNKGTFVTNNAYYAFMTGTETNITLDVSGYTTASAALSSCNGESIRMALYDVSSCPVGQNYPQPVSCATFSSDGNLNLSSLQPNHKYLLYFDGVRNTKASFSVTFNADSSSVTPTTNTTTIAFPNPSSTSTTIQINNATGSFYEYALFDDIGKKILTGKVSVLQSTQTFPLYLNAISSGVYFLRLTDENGKVISKTKILKTN